ncbi:MAG: 23S rRNA (guanosine(2251)-2'-O)-methyltransferase RlmB [Acidobacteria bacterium]|nr:23S rRNA (guanosine(2251)-2'-O)-methyltransferase RlmB [Acidobacteriota bacterium]
MKVIYGIHSVLEALKSQAWPIEKILMEKEARNPRLREIAGLARSLGVPVQFEPREALSRRAGVGSHQGVMALAPPVGYVAPDEIFRQAGPQPLFLILDGIEDPHNLGAILRTAEGAGVDGVFLPQRRAVGVTDVVMKTSSGAAAYLRIARVTNIASLIQEMKKNSLWVVGVHTESDTIWTAVDYNQPIALVMGGEGKGLHRLVRERCDFLVTIPMHGKVDSLNVSVSAGVVLYEVIRQRRQGLLKG